MLPCEGISGEELCFLGREVQMTLVPDSEWDKEIKEIYYREDRQNHSPPWAQSYDIAQTMLFSVKMTYIDWVLLGDIVKLLIVYRWQAFCTRMHLSRCGISLHMCQGVVGHMWVQDILCGKVENSKGIRLKG